MTVAIRQPEKAEPEVEGQKLWTVADLAMLPEQLPTGPVRWELWDGEFRLMPPMSDEHGSVQINFGVMLKVHGQWEGHGRVSGGDVGVVIQPESPQTAFGADVVFLTADQLPARRSKEGYLLTIPAIVVEVRSKNDTAKEIQEKVRRYLLAGVRLVWVADDRKRTVTAYQQEQEPQTLDEDATLTAEGIIPGLAFPVRRLFEGLE